MRTPERAGRELLLALAVAAVYLAAAKLGLALAVHAPQVSAVWPPTGVALAAVLRLRRPGVAGVLLGAFLANATTPGEGLAVALAIAAGNTLEAMAGAALLRRAGFQLGLARVRDVLALLAAAAVSPVVSATVGVAALGAGGVHPLADLPLLWRVWWLGDALGDLVVAPLLLLAGGAAALVRGRRRAAEAAALAVGLLAACGVAFRQSPPGPVSEYAVFPFLIWGALRFGPAGAAAVTAVIYAAAVWGTVGGLGPFDTDPGAGLVVLQLFMAAAAATGLLLAAVAAQQRAAQESARTAERRLLVALRAARMGVWDWSITSGEVRWSEGLEQLYGLEQGGFAGTLEAFLALVHPEDRPRVERAIWEAVESRAPYRVEFRLAAEGGEPRWIAGHGQVQVDQAGRAVRMLGVGIDVTDAKRLEAQLLGQAERLADADRRKDDFLAMLAHELRNPLAPILHATELLGREAPPEVADSARAMIRRQTEHLRRLLDDLLDVARITRGAIHLERRPTTLGEAVAAAVESTRPALAARRQELTVALPERPLWLDADPVRLAQVLANLLHNAGKFTLEGGSVRLEAAEEPAGTVTVRVRDTGIGMTREVLAAVFEPFAQGPRPPDLALAGLGLGLTLVRQLVELHGGSVEAASEGPGEGSELVVRLPAAAPPAAAEAPAAPVAEAAPRPAPGRRILVVDDNADVVASLALLLDLDGHDVRTAADGRAALLVAESFRPEVILLDLGLPELDGYAVARTLRDRADFAATRIVAISGYGQPEDRERSTAAGIDLHLLKPVEPSRLRELLR